MAKFTYEEVERLNIWREGVIETIKGALSDMLESDKTSEEEDREIAEEVFARLLGVEALELPLRPEPTEERGSLPKIPEGF